MNIFADLPEHILDISPKICRKSVHARLLLIVLYSMLAVTKVCDGMPGSRASTQSFEHRHASILFVSDGPSDTPQADSASILCSGQADAAPQKQDKLSYPTKNGRLGKPWCLGNAWIYKYRILLTATGYYAAVHRSCDASRSSLSPTPSPSLLGSKNCWFERTLYHLCKQQPRTSWPSWLFMQSQKFLCRGAVVSETYLVSCPHERPCYCTLSCKPFPILQTEYSLYQPHTLTMYGWTPQQSWHNPIGIIQFLLLNV